MAISDTMLRALTPTRGPGGMPKTAPYEVAAGEGLLIEVMPGGAKIWRFRYRLNGKREKVTIGPYPAIPIADQVRGGKVVTKGAHSYRGEFQSLVAAGKSPAREKRERKARGGEDEATLEGFAAKRFIPEVIAQHKRADTDRRRLNRHILRTLGGRQLDGVDTPDLLAILDAICAKGHVQEARQVLILARQFFDHAIARQRITRNPAKDIPMKMVGKAGSRDRALNSEEIGKLLRAFDSADFLHPAHTTALRLLLLTLCRKGELVAAKWSDVDFEKAEWHIPASNQKIGIPHMVPLASQAAMLFRRLKELSRGSEYVLPSLQGKGDKPMAESSLNWALWQITRKRGKAPARLGIPHFTLHDFRRTASTLLHGNGYDTDVIEKALGHKIKGVRGIYNVATYAPERRTMLQFWATFLDGLAQGKVIPLRKAG